MANIYYHLRDLKPNLELRLMEDDFWGVVANDFKRKEGNRVKQIYYPYVNYISNCKKYGINYKASHEEPIRNYFNKYYR